MPWYWIASLIVTGIFLFLGIGSALWTSDNGKVVWNVLGFTFCFAPFVAWITAVVFKTLLSVF